MMAIYYGCFIGYASILGIIEAEGRLTSITISAFSALSSVIILFSAIAMVKKKKWSRTLLSIGLHLIVVVYTASSLLEENYSLEILIFWLFFTVPITIIILLLYNKNFKLNS